MKIAIRVDASGTIGLGHLQRCLALAAALREAGGHTVFVARDLGVDVAARVRAAGFDAVLLPRPTADAPVADGPAYAAWAGVAWQRDADETAQALAGTRPDWLVVDHYAFDARWHAELRRRLGAKLAAIDDLADRALDVDLLIDHNFAEDHRAKYRSVLGPATRMLCGPRHALLGPAYAAAAPHVVHERVRSIGIFMGGADPGDLSSLVLRACRDGAGFRGPIEIVTTSANPHRAALAELAARWPATTLSVDLADLAAFFSRHDLQVGAGGGASWERCRTGAPSLLLVTAANQQAVVPGLARLGAVAALEDAGPPTQAAVAEAVSALLHDSAARHHLAEVSRTLVDGLGARRVAVAMLSESLTVRLARADDAAMMLRWRNDPATRAVSRDAAAIDPQAHEVWLQRVLADAGRCLLVGHVGEVDVGVIRFDNLGGAVSEVSLYLDPALFELGLGRWLLRAGEAKVQALHSVPRTLVATVLDGNLGSQRMFAACGYARRGTQWCKTVGPTSLELTSS